MWMSSMSAPWPLPILRSGWNPLQPGFNSFGWTIIIKKYTVVKYIDGYSHSQKVANTSCKSPQANISRYVPSRASSCFCWDCMPCRDFSRITRRMSWNTWASCAPAKNPQDPVFRHQIGNWIFDYDRCKPVFYCVVASDIFYFYPFYLGKFE